MSESSAALGDHSIPYLPRGVRLRYDETREHWSLLGPERVFKLDQVSLEILKRCDGEATLTAIIADLAVAFEERPETIDPDVRAFLQDMQARAMLTFK
ncbi:MAG: pyrroloquinoline quinone biosynthesis peptide chaperone PqqD [Pseudomonadota bacterium]